MAPASKKGKQKAADAEKETGDILPAPSGFHLGQKLERKLSASTDAFVVYVSDTKHLTLEELDKIIEERELPSGENQPIKDVFYFVAAFADRFDPLDLETWRQGAHELVDFFRNSMSPSRMPIVTSKHTEVMFLRTFLAHLLIGYDKLPSSMRLYVHKNKDKFRGLPRGPTLDAIKRKSSAQIESAPGGCLGKALKDAKQKLKDTDPEPSTSKSTPAELWNQLENHTREKYPLLSGAEISAKCQKFAARQLDRYRNTINKLQSSLDEELVNRDIADTITLNLFEEHCSSSQANSKQFRQEREKIAKEQRVALKEMLENDYKAKNESRLMLLNRLRRDLKIPLTMARDFEPDLPSCSEDNTSEEESESEEEPDDSVDANEGSSPDSDGGYESLIANHTDVVESTPRRPTNVKPAGESDLRSRRKPANNDADADSRSVVDKPVDESSRHTRSSSAANKDANANSCPAIDKPADESSHNKRRSSANDEDGRPAKRPQLGKATADNDSEAAKSPEPDKPAQKKSKRKGKKKKNNK